MESAAKHYVFEPLNMENSSFDYLPTVTPYIKGSSFMLYIMMPWVVIAAVVFLLGFLIGFFTKYRFFSKQALFYISILIGYVCEILLLIFILPRLIIPAVVIGAAGGIILWLTRNGRRMYFTSFLAFTAIMISGLMFVPISYPIGAEIPHKAPNAAFSLKTTSRDMTHFGEKLLDLYNNEDVFVTEMFSPQVELDRDNSWGLGLAIERVGEEQYYWHSGINPGMHSLIVMDPDSAKVLVIMTNSDYGFEFAREVSSNEFGMFGDWEIPRDTLKN